MLSRMIQSMKQSSGEAPIVAEAAIDPPADGNRARPYRTIPTRAIPTFSPFEQFPFFKPLSALQAIDIESKLY